MIACHAYYHRNQYEGKSENTVAHQAQNEMFEREYLFLAMFKSHCLAIFGFGNMYRAAAADLRQAITFIS